MVGLLVSRVECFCLRTRNTLENTLLLDVIAKGFGAKNHYENINNLLLNTIEGWPCVGFGQGRPSKKTGTFKNNNKETAMIIAYVGLFLVSIAGLHVLRQYLCLVPQAPVNHEAFHGKLYKVGNAVVAYQPARVKAKRTVITMPGFLEDHRYFTQLYTQDDVELILLNSCNYHPPVIPNHAENCSFFNKNGFIEGTIAYDAAVLNWATQNLVTTQQVRVHGHSRGGAVVLEAVKQNPDLHKKHEVVLEAPVLPQGQGYPALEFAFGAVGLYLLPLFVPLLKRIPVDLYASIIYRPLNPRKKTLIAGLFFNPRTYQTILDNVHDLEQWMQQTDYSIYQHVTRGYVLIGEVDTVLDRSSMLLSARQAGERLTVIETKNTSHFVSLDDPSAVPTLSSVQVGAAV